MTTHESTVSSGERTPFSRFATNFEKGSALPIFTLLEPDTDGGMGAVLVGDYVANDFVDYMERVDPSFRQRWLVVSTTQSDTVPVDVTRTDCNIFSNKSGEHEYLNSSARNVPHSLALADGLFVDPDIFSPSPEPLQPESDILYVAKWFPTKKTELLLEVAEAHPEISIMIYGWLMASERKHTESVQYRKMVMGAAAMLGNVTVYDADDFSATGDHINPDGSTVLGPLTKVQIRDQFMRKSNTGIYLSEETEAVNRFATEMLACDKPMIVALPTHGGMERFMQDGHTSKFCERTPEGIAEAYHDIMDHRQRYSPRESFLSFGGREKSNATLRGIVEQLANARGRQLSSGLWNTYGGDLWTLPENYNRIRSN